MTKPLQGIYWRHDSFDHARLFTNSKPLQRRVRCAKNTRLQLNRRGAHLQPVNHAHHVQHLAVTWSNVEPVNLKPGQTNKKKSFNYHASPLSMHLGALHKKSFSFLVLKLYVPGWRTAKNQRAEAEGCFGHMHSLACQIINLWIHGHQAWCI